MYSVQYITVLRTLFWEAHKYIFSYGFDLKLRKRSNTHILELSIEYLEIS